MPVDGRNGPIFVVGVPRSGTTLLRYMLCSHPRIYLPPESNFIPRFFRRNPERSLSREQAIRILEQIREYRPFWRDWRAEALNPQELVDALAERTPTALLTALYARYAEQFGATRWGDKSPMYANSLDLIAELFPSSQIIHIIRDPRDVTASSLTAYRGARFFYMDAYYAGRRWRESVQRARAAGRFLPPDRYLELRYEDLTSDPERHLRELCGFLGEDFHPAMAAPGAEARRHHHSQGIHRRVRGPITTSSAGRWRRDLGTADQRLVQRAAGDLLADLGYPVADLGRPSMAERPRAAALRTKYGVVATGRRLLLAMGVFHPTRLLEVPRRHHVAGAGNARPTPPGAKPAADDAVTSKPTSGTT
jgi:hypothetical protein